MAETRMNLKLMIDNKANKVLFAEAGKEFVDFLFHILSLPVGTVVNLLKADNMVGSLGFLHKSIKSLSSKYLQPNIDRDAILKPKLAVKIPLLGLTEGSSATCSRVYRCLTHVNYVSHDFNAICPCGQTINTQINYVNPKNGTEFLARGDVRLALRVNKLNMRARSRESEGYVKEVVTYMVMDNLELKTMSNISSIDLMKKFHVNDVNCLNQKTVQVRLPQALAMLKASLETEEVLTTVFLGITNKASSTIQQYPDQYQISSSF